MATKDPVTNAPDSKVVQVAPMPDDWHPDEQYLVAGANGVRLAIAMDPDDTLDDERRKAATLRSALWMALNGATYPAPEARPPGVCPACGAREHFQDTRLADPAAREAALAAA